MTSHSLAIPMTSPPRRITVCVCSASWRMANVVRMERCQVLRVPPKKRTKKHPHILILDMTWDHLSKGTSNLVQVHCMFYGFANLRWSTKMTKMIQVFGFQCTYTLDPDRSHHMPVDSDFFFRSLLKKVIHDFLTVTQGLGRPQSIPSLKLTYIAPEKNGPGPKRKIRLPTINFHGIC